MGNTKKEFLLKFIENIQEPGVIDAINDMLEGEIFVEKVRQKTGLIPVWVVFNVHVSQMGNRYKTGISKAFREKRGASDYIYTVMMSKASVPLEIEVAFVDKDSSKVFYALRRNNLGYSNYDQLFKNESQANVSTGEDIQIKEVDIE